jgi:hypothetical protein
LPEFHRFCLQTAVNHENAAGDGFPGKSVIVIKSLLLVGRANIAGSLSFKGNGNLQRQPPSAGTPSKQE